MSDIFLSILAGLMLFLFAVSRLSDSIQASLGEQAKKWILRFTSNTFMAILTGLVVTTLLDSSSAVIIITIVFVNSRLLTFRQAMGIVLGANIGTTISSQIIAMDIGKYAPLLLFIGFGLSFIVKKEGWKRGGDVLFYFGLLFFGLSVMEQSVEPLKEQPYFLELLKNTEQPIFGALTGALVTLVIQSSSATVGMAIILAKKGLLGLGGGIAIMLGAELGTCSDTLLATIKGNQQAIKTGLFHLIFNFISILIGLILFHPFTDLVAFISGTQHLEHAVANAHVIFNVGGVLIFVRLLPIAEHLLNYLLPEKPTKNLVTEEVLAS